MRPFSRKKDPDIRNVNCIENASFPKQLNSKAFKYHIIEMYDTTKGVLLGTISHEVGIGALLLYSELWIDGHPK